MAAVWWACGGHDCGVYLVVVETNGCATEVVNIVAWWCMGLRLLTARQVIAVSLGYISLVMRRSSEGQKDAEALEQ